MEILKPLLGLMAICSGLVFSGLTAYAYGCRKDGSFLSAMGIMYGWWLFFPSTVLDGRRGDLVLWARITVIAMFSSGFLAIWIAD